MMPFVSMPLSFVATGTNSGVRRYRPDLGLVKSELPCVAAGTFTKNTFKASPVLYNMKLLPSSDIRGLVVNSGHANAATGALGDKDNLQLVEEAAKAMGLDAQQVLVASTGVVGERLPLNKLLPALPQATRAFADTINNFALAIMTTDLVPKYGTRVVKLSGGECRLTACAKGSGMIHPNMATMLGFVMSDVKISSADLQKTLIKAVDSTFNMISVDGETSTNDMVLALANGASQVELCNEGDRQVFLETFEDLCRDLAMAIARDGEGASKLITVQVAKSPSLGLARECARWITTSPLIKSAIHGEDPNWGRIMVRLGQCGVPAELFEKLEIRIQDVLVFAKGLPQSFDRSQAREALQSDHVRIEVLLGQGDYVATAWGCDLTKRYVEINTEYS